MKAGELRVGNWVNSYTGHSVEAMRVGIQDFEQAWKLQPIPLTEEWLVRMGITNLNSIETRGGDLFVEIENKEVGIGGADSCTSGMIYYARCEYVHQLQNLIFALTGEELEIKEK